MSQQLPRPTVSVMVPMRFRDLDAYGHVNNATIFNYLEEARIILLGEEFYNTPMNEVQFLVQRASCSYIHPILLEPQLRIDISVVQLKMVSFVLEYSLINSSGTECARAETTMACFDPQRNRPIKIPKWFIERFE